MITQGERDKLNQWYADYSANNAKPMDYVTWLEYMLVHRTNLLQQSAEYADSLESTLGDIVDASSIFAHQESTNTVQIAAFARYVIDKAKDALTEAE